MINTLLAINGVEDSSKGGFSALIANWKPLISGMKIELSSGFISSIIKKNKINFPTTFLFNIDSQRIPLILRVFLNLIDGIFFILVPANKKYKKITFIIGNSYTQLFSTIIISYFSRSISIYFVDDIKYHLTINNKKYQIPLFLFLIRYLKNRKVTFCAITPKLAENFSKLCQLNVSYIPLPYNFESNFKVIKKTNIISKEIFFVGSINQEILDAIYNFILRLPNGWKLNILTASNNKYDFKDYSNKVNIIYHLDDHSAFKIANECIATLIPYSFNLKHRQMVESSFPSKILKAVLFNKPIIVYGPIYQSLKSFPYKNELIFFPKNYRLKNLTQILGFTPNFSKLKQTHNIKNLLLI
jgi:hypothetical protein